MPNEVGKPEGVKPRSSPESKITDGPKSKGKRNHPGCLEERHCGEGKRKRQRN